MTNTASNIDFASLIADAPKSERFTAAIAQPKGKEISESELASRTSGSVEAVDVVIKWQDSVLHVAQLKPC